MTVNRGLTTRWGEYPSAGATRGILGGAAIVALGAGVACGERDPAAPIPLYTVTVHAGDQQRAPAGAELANPLELDVRDPDGVPAKGIAVRFRVVGGRGAKLVDTLVATDADGLARTRLRLAADADTVSIDGGVRGQESRGVTFRLGATAAPSLASVQPSAFASGDTITLRGFRLNALTTDAPAPLFGAVRGRIVGAPSDTLLRVVAPSCLGAGTVSIAVRVGTVTTNALPSTVSIGVKPLSLAPGEAVTIRGADAACLRLPDDAQRYILIPQLATADTVPVARTYALAVDASPTTAAVATFENTPNSVSPVRLSFERMLRAAERDVARGMASDTTSSRATRPALLRAVVAPPALGTTRSFRVLSRIDGTAFATATATLRYAGTNILIYEDVGAPSKLTDAALQSLGTLFDGTLYGIDVGVFGAESDIDGNGRVIVLMTPIVNSLTPAAQCSSTGYVPGFFFGADLDGRNTNSNHGEIFYSFVPDPRGDRSCVHTQSDILGLLPATFLHEFQHMISFNQHALVRRAGSETVWLNEGLSHLAEELGARYYDARFPAPTGRSLPGQFLPDSAMAFIRGDLDDAALYMSTVSTRSVTAFADYGSLEERGAAWLFLHWLGVQKGDGIFARLVQSGLRSRENVEAAAGEPFADLFGDFAIMMYADSLPGFPRSAIAPRYRFGTRTLRELMDRSTTRGAYPLTVRAAPASGAVAAGSLLPGTAAFFQIAVPRGGAALRFSGPNGATLPATLVPQLGVVRVTR